MNKEYYNLLIEKMLLLPTDVFETDLNSCNSNLERVVVKFSQDVKITIRCESDMLKIEIDNRYKRTDGQIPFPLKIPIFSASWWKWRKLARKIEKAYKCKRLIEAELTKRKKKLEMDETMTDIFPEIVEKNLLGDGDDK